MVHSRSHSFHATKQHSAIRQPWCGIKEQWWISSLRNIASAHHIRDIAFDHDKNTPLPFSNISTMVKNMARRLRITFTLSMPRNTNSLWSRALPAHSLMSQQSTGVCEPFNDSDHGWSREYRACWCFQQHHGHAAVHLRYWCTYGETNYRLSDHTNWPCSTYFLYNRNCAPLDIGSFKTSNT